MTKKQIARMARIRAARGLPPQTRDNMMRRAAAVLCLSRAAHSARGQREIELRGFMAIFHPEVSDDVVRQLVRDSEAV